MNIKSKCRRISSCNAESETSKELPAVTWTPLGLGGMDGSLMPNSVPPCIVYLENARLLIYADLSSVALHSV